MCTLFLIFTGVDLWGGSEPYLMGLSAFVNMYLDEIVQGTLAARKKDDWPEMRMLAHK